MQKALILQETQDNTLTCPFILKSQEYAQTSRPIVNRPFISIIQQGYKHLELFDNFSILWNANAAPKDQLKEHHRNMYKALIGSLCYQFKRDNDKLKDTPQLLQVDPAYPPSLWTNRAKIAETMGGEYHGKDKSTIHRYIVRMIKAGVIKEKVYHGNQNDFELFINPELLLIADLDNPDYIPTSPWENEKSETENRALQSTSIASCNGSSSSLPEHLSNDNNTHKAYRTGTTLQETDENKNENTVNDARNRQALQDKNAHQFTFQPTGTPPPTPARPPQSKLDKLKEYHANALIIQIKNILFANRPDIYPGEWEIAKKIVLSQYYAKCSTMNEVEIQTRKYTWGIHAVRSYIERSNFSMQFIYPAAYLNTNNTGKCSFATVMRQWWTAMKQQQKDKITEKEAQRDRYLTTLRKLAADSENQANYHKQEQYLKNNMPERLNDFYSSL